MTDAGDKVVGATVAVCSYCHTATSSADAISRCPSCQAAYHADCWEENGGCAVYGCLERPEQEARSDLEVPAAYWGRERKECPKCHADIAAAAVRCRECGATFATARPQDSAEYRASQKARDRDPALRRTVKWLFALCVVPVTAPVAWLLTLVWYGANRRHLPRLPGIYAGLIRLGVAIGFIQLILLAVATAGYMLRQGSAGP